MLQYVNAEYVATAACFVTYVATGITVLVVTATVASRASLAGRAGVGRTAVAGVVWGVMIAATPFVLVGVVWTQTGDYDRPVRAAAMLVGMVAPVLLARFAAIVALSTTESRP